MAISSEFAYAEPSFQITLYDVSKRTNLQIALFPTIANGVDFPKLCSDLVACSEYGDEEAGTWNCGDDLSWMSDWKMGSVW